MSDERSASSLKLIRTRVGPNRGPTYYDVSCTKNVRMKICQALPITPGASELLLIIFLDEIKIRMR